MSQPESPIEWAFWEAAAPVIPDLKPQFWIGSYRVDFAVEHRRLIIEVDGYDYHHTREQRNQDTARELDLQVMGWSVVRFTGSQIYANVDRCVGQTTRLLEMRPEFNPVKRQESPEIYYCTRMQEIITYLLDKHGLGGEDDCHLLLTMGEEFYPLSIEKHGTVISVSHYFEQNHDICYDPSIEFLIVSMPCDYNEWTPSEMWQVLNGIRRCAEVREDGSVTVTDLTLQGAIASYAEGWAKRIRLNGWLDHAERKT